MQITCPVRGCGLPLAWGDPIACPRGHRFDRARSGYVSLLQPQDKKAKDAGDPKEAVRARRRLTDRGLAVPIRDAVLQLGPIGPVLDVGCGEGFLLGSLGIDGCGVDLSTAALELAAKRWPERTWIAANADRSLPFADGSFGTILSITARKNALEFRRLLAENGRVIIGVAGDDDLAELREAVLGRSEGRDRAAKTIAAMEPHLRPIGEHDVRWKARLDRDALADLLAATYRGARRREQERFADVAALDVTFHLRLLVMVQGSEV